MALEETKRFTTIEEQIELLQSRGMTVSDKTEAAQWLRSVGYYRLSGYWYVRRVPQQTGNIPTRLDTFQRNTDFSDIAKLYEFDRKLRTHTHDGVERLEVALRNAITLVLGEQNPLALYENSYFRNPEQHIRLLATAHQRISRSMSTNDSIRHNVEKYGPQLAIWVLTDVLDFSDLSKLFSLVQPEYQKAIAELLGIDFSHVSFSESQRRQLRRAHPLQSGLHQLTLLRNKCAHHARIWNTDLVPMGTPVLRQIAGLEALPTESSKKLYGALLLLSKILETVSPGSTWATKTESLIRETEANISFFNAGMIGAPREWSLLAPR